MLTALQLVTSFFMMIFLTLFQSSYKGAAGVTAIAAIIFVLWFVGTLAVAGYACFYRLRFGHYQSLPDRLHFEKRMAWGSVPWLATFRDGDLQEKSGAAARAVNLLYPLVACSLRGQRSWSHDCPRGRRVHEEVRLARGALPPHALVVLRRLAHLRVCARLLLRRRRRAPYHAGLRPADRRDHCIGWSHQAESPTRAPDSMRWSSMRWASAR